LAEAHAITDKVEAAVRQVAGEGADVTVHAEPLVPPQ
jgi:divalent metal cation (Fe/Co/Zn/Cd) transporter